MIDKVFGELNFDSIWEKEDKINMFGLEYNITLEIYGNENKEVSDLQRQAYLNFKNNFNIEDIERSIFKYYQDEICEEYRDMLDDEADELVPIIKEVNELKNIVKPTELVILDLDNTRRIGLLFECSWDIDAGVGVVIENEKILKVGAQCIAL